MKTAFVALFADGHAFLLDEVDVAGAATAPDPAPAEPPLPVRCRPCLDVIAVECILRDAVSRRLTPREVARSFALYIGMGDGMEEFDADQFLANVER